MVQPIQSNQLSPIQGSIGQQRVVQEQGPTIGSIASNAVQQGANTVDMVGDIYAKNEAQALVENTIEEVDAAVAAAERGAKENTFSKKAPQELAVNNDEWLMIQNAVASGAMTQEKARLIASSRLRTRIAEQPLFADKLRQAASGVLGFNIESEAARQYFAALPTEAAARGGSGRQTYQQKIDEQATAIANTIGVDFETARRTLVTADFAEQQKSALASQLQMGAISAQKYTSDMEVEDQKTAFATLMGEVRAFEAENGKPIDNLAFGRILDERKQVYIEQFNKGWTDANGTLNSPEYTRALTSINQRYDQYKEYIDSVGVDNITAVELERTERARQALGDQFFGPMKFVRENFGDRVMSDMVNLASLSDAQRDLVLSRSPQLQQAWQFLNGDPQRFTQTMSSAAQKMLSGQELTEVESNFADYVVKEITTTGSDESKDALVDGLFRSGLPWKGLSSISANSPRLETAERKQYFKTMFEQDLEPTLKQFAAEMTASPAFRWEVGSDGKLMVINDNPAGGLPAVAPGGLITNPAEQQRDIVAFNRAKQVADKINLFAEGLNNGWSRELNTSLGEYINLVNTSVSEAETVVQNLRAEQEGNRFLGLVESGQIEEAREAYSEMQSRNPALYQRSFDDLAAEARRRLQGAQ